MPRTFHAVPTDHDGKELVDRTEIILSDTDFAAMRQAQDAFGPGINFDLWEGDPLVMRFRPITTGG